MRVAAEDGSPLELYEEIRKVRVLDGDRPGQYEMHTYHHKTCARWAGGKLGDGDCDCDFLIGELEFLHGLQGPN
jgi:hypothetical protein